MAAAVSGHMTADEFEEQICRFVRISDRLGDGWQAVHADDGTLYMMKRCIVQTFPGLAENVQLYDPYNLARTKYTATATSTPSSTITATSSPPSPSTTTTIATTTNLSTTTTSPNPVFHEHTTALSKTPDMDKSCKLQAPQQEAPQSDTNTVRLGNPPTLPKHLPPVQTSAVPACKHSAQHQHLPQTDSAATDILFVGDASSGVLIRKASPGADSSSFHPHGASQRHNAHQEQQPTSQLQQRQHKRQRLHQQAVSADVAMGLTPDAPAPSDDASGAAFGEYANLGQDAQHRDVNCLIQRGFPEVDEDVSEESEDMALRLQEMEMDEEEDDDECSLTPATQQTTLTYEYHVIYSPSYNVPVLYLNIFTADGKLLPLDQVWAHSPASYQAFLRNNKWTTLTQQEHPMLGRPFLQLHPCHTADMMQQLGKSDPGRMKRRYMASWLSTVGPLISLQISPAYIFDSP